MRNNNLILDANWISFKNQYDHIWLSLNYLITENYTGVTELHTHEKISVMHGWSISIEQWREQCTFASKEVSGFLAGKSQEFHIKI